MGKIILFENKRIIIRNFSEIQRFTPNGVALKPLKWDGLIILKTGDGDEDRPLELLARCATPREPVVRLDQALAFGLGVVAAVGLAVIAG